MGEKIAFAFIVKIVRTLFLTPKMQQNYAYPTQKKSTNSIFGDLENFLNNALNCKKNYSVKYMFYNFYGPHKKIYHFEKYEQKYQKLANFSIKKRQSYVAFFDFCPNLQQNANDSALALVDNSAKCFAHFCLRLFWHCREFV